MYRNSEPVSFQNIQWVVCHKIRVLTKHFPNNEHVPDPFFKVQGFLCSLNLGATDEGDFENNANFISCLCLVAALVANIQVYIHVNPRSYHNMQQLTVKTWYYGPWWYQASLQAP